MDANQVGCFARKSGWLGSGSRVARQEVCGSGGGCVCWDVFSCWGASRINVKKSPAAWEWSGPDCESVVSVVDLSTSSR